MRRIKYLLGITVLVASLTACGQENTANDQGKPVEQIPEQTVEVQSETTPVTVAETQPQDEGSSLTEEDFVVDINGVAVKLGDDMSTLESSLGEPDSYETAKSCMGAGEDKVYEFGGITIYTYPIDGVDVVSAIEFTGEETLAAGIGVGSTKDEVLTAYGSDCEQDEYSMTYELGDKTLGIELDGDSVSFIEIYGE